MTVISQNIPVQLTLTFNASNADDNNDVKLPYMYCVNFVSFLFCQTQRCVSNHAAPRAELHTKHSFSLVCQALHIFNMSIHVKFIIILNSV